MWKSNQVGPCKVLFEAGVDIQAVDNNGWTALHIAVENGRSEVLKYLLTFPKLAKDVNKQERIAGRTALHIASANGYLDFVKLLLDHGAQINMTSRKAVSAIHEALINQHFEVVEFLFGAGAKLRHSESTEDGLSDFHLACQFGLTSVVKKELETLSPAAINQGVQTPLWLACNNGHVEVVSLLLSQPGCNISSPAPDSTTPLTIALLRGHPKVAQCFQLKMDNKEFLEVISKFRDTEKVESGSDLTELCLNIPAYNDEIEKVNPSSYRVIKTMRGSRERYVSLSDLDKRILHNLCPFSNEEAEGSDAPNILYLSNLKSDTSKIMHKDTCTSKHECMQVQNLLHIAQQLEVTLNREERLLAELRPRFILVGSVPERTRFYDECKTTTELDILVLFEGVREMPLKVHDAMTLYVEDEDHPLKRFCETRANEQGHFIFNMSYFFQEYLKEIKSCLLEVKMPDERTSFGSANKLCPNCNNEMPYKHCEDCFFAVTHTKAGACLVLNRISSRGQRLILTMDLLPMLPVEANNVMDLFNSLTKTLLEKRPAGWLSHLRKVVQKERIFPDEIAAALKKESEDGVIEVGIKLLNYGNQDNFVIRPAQLLQLQSFRRFPILRRVYCHVKGLKTVLGIDLSSSLFCDSETRFNSSILILSAK